jgi:hypothetical protein
MAKKILAFQSSIVFSSLGVDMSYNARSRWIYEYTGTV